MINFNLDISMAINNHLCSRGLRNNDLKISDEEYCNFSVYEIQEVTELNINNCYDINDIYKLPNLRKLYIESVDYNKIAPYFDYKDSTVINHIEDFSAISKLTNLEELVIANDVYIKELDISNLSKLKKLVLINNPLLTKLYGLEYLKNLNEVTMYGNSISGDNFDFDSYASNTRLCDENTLDISMYLGIINHDKLRSKSLADYEIKGESFVRFGEKSGFLNCVCLSLRDLYDMYNKLDIYFRSKNAYFLDELDKISFVYSYGVNNVTFSKELIIRRNMEYKSDKNQYGNIPARIVKSLNNFHSSYYAYRFKQANCEGKTNLNIFMLRMLGIPCFNVHCHDKRDIISTGSNHSIARVQLSDGSSRYLDPSIDVKNPYDYFLVDYEKMSERVDLDAFEYSLYRKEIEKEEKKYVI